MPLVYTRHTARFLSCWLLLLPLALWEPFGTSWNHLAVVLATTLVAIFFFGIEELAVNKSTLTGKARVDGRQSAAAVDLSLKGSKIDLDTLLGRTVGEGKIGPITRRLHKHFDDVVHGRVESRKNWLSPVWG